MLNKAITKYIGDTRLSPILLENYKYDSNNNLIEQSINNQKYNFFYKNDFNKTLDYILFNSFKFYPLFDVNNRYIDKKIYYNNINKSSNKKYYFLMILTNNFIYKFLSIC